jgi:hypothetical protein
VLGRLVVSELPLGLVKVLDAFYGRVLGPSGLHTRRRFEGWKFFCPCHKDDQPSLHVSLSDDSRRVLLHCFGGCRTKDVLKSVGLTFQDLFLKRGEITEESRSPAVAVSALPLPDPFVLHEAYLAFLEGLGPLAVEHKRQLGDRGLTDLAIETNNYRSLRFFNGLRSAEKVLGHFGHEVVRAVPGFEVTNCPARGWRARPVVLSGLVIPCRSADGRIVGLKVRLDDPRGPKYIWMSGPGTSVGSPIHHPGYWRYHASAGMIRVTEGLLKADVAQHLSQTATIGLPGLSAPGLAELLIGDPELSVAKPKVLLSFDSDWQSKPSVRRALTTLADGLVKAGLGHRLFLEYWFQTEGKGIDDLYKNGHVPSRFLWLAVREDIISGQEIKR